MQGLRIIGGDKFVEKKFSDADNYTSSLKLSQMIKSTYNILNLSKARLLQKIKSREVTFAKHMIGYLNKYHGKATMESIATEFLLDLSLLSPSIAKIKNNINDLLVLKVIKK